MRLLFSALVFLSAVCFSCQFADAGVLTYNAGSGGTFDPSSASTFTFTNFGQGTLVSGVSYTSARVRVKWGGTAPLPAGGFVISAISSSGPTASFGDITFGGSTAAGVFQNDSYVALPSAVTTLNLASLTLTATIPVMTVSDGFSLEFALQLEDAAQNNTNMVASQTVTAFNSSAVPEPGTYAAGLIVTIAAAIVRRRRRQTVSA